jgi:hypothetical protein
LQYADFHNAVLILDTDTPIDVLDPARYLKSPNLLPELKKNTNKSAKCKVESSKMPMRSKASKANHPKTTKKPSPSASSLDRSIDRSIAQSLGQSLERSVDRSIASPSIVL